jgi:hypothetical protein
VLSKSARSKEANLDKTDSQSSLTGLYSDLVFQDFVPSYFQASLT